MIAGLIIATLLNSGLVIHRTDFTPHQECGELGVVKDHKYHPGPCHTVKTTQVDWMRCSSGDGGSWECVVNEYGRWRPATKEDLQDALQQITAAEGTP